MVRGHRYGLKCGCCKYSVIVDEGIGMLYYPEQLLGTSGRFAKPLLLDIINLHKDTDEERIREKVKELIEAGANLQDNYGHALYMCSEYNKLYNHFYFQLDNYIPDYKCQCGIRLKRCYAKGNLGQVHIFDFKKRKMDWRCPECGSDDLQYDVNNMIDWD